MNNLLRLVFILSLSGCCFSGSNVKNDILKFNYFAGQEVKYEPMSFYKLQCSGKAVIINYIPYFDFKHSFAYIAKTPSNESCPLEILLMEQENGLVMTEVK